jgi:hypothetical protein
MLGRCNWFALKHLRTESRYRFTGCSEDNASVIQVASRRRSFITESAISGNRSDPIRITWAERKFSGGLCTDQEKHPTGVILQCFFTNKTESGVRWNKYTQASRLRCQQILLLWFDVCKFLPYVLTMEAFFSETVLPSYQNTRYTM